MVPTRHWDSAGLGSVRRLVHGDQLSPKKKKKKGPVHSPQERNERERGLVWHEEEDRYELTDIHCFPLATSFGVP